MGVKPITVGHKVVPLGFDHVSHIEKAFRNGYVPVSIGIAGTPAFKKIVGKYPVAVRRVFIGKFLFSGSTEYKCLKRGNITGFVRIGGSEIEG